MLPQIYIQILGEENQLEEEVLYPYQLVLERFISQIIHDD
jgi:hypothetical protein